MTQYYQDKLNKYIEIYGGNPPIVEGIPESMQETVQMIIVESYLEGYKKAKKKYKKKLKKQKNVNLVPLSPIQIPNFLKDFEITCEDKA